MALKFPAHGRAHYVFDGPIVRLHVEGPWNEELVTETHASLRKALKDAGQPWALIVMPRKSALCDAAALQAIRAAAEDEKTETRRMATAWVLPRDLEGAEIMAIAVTRAYEGVQPVAVFETEAEAEQWVARMLGVAADAVK